MYLPTENALALPLAFSCSLMAVLGAMIGSFLNVVIYRLPREQSIVFPNSACPSCRHPIKPYDNIPVLSFLILGGRCRSCGSRISIRYPVVEALTALLFAAVTWHDGLSFALAFDLAFVASLVALIFIDADHMILPNAITYPGILFAVITRLIVPHFASPAHFDDLPQLISILPAKFPLAVVSLIGASLGALVGGGSLWLMGFLWEKLRGIEAMGFGDVKMMLMVGAFLGWRLTILTILLGAFIGSLAGIGLMLQRGQRNLQMMLPFGIFLGIGSIMSLLIGTRLIAWYGSLFH